MPMREDALPQPVSPYGVTKLAAEQLCHLYHVNYGVPTVSLRYFTVYGPRQRPDMGFNRFFSAVLAGRPLIQYGDGLQTRDFTFVADAVSGHRRRRQSAGVPGRVYNIGGGSRVSLLEVFDLIGRVSGRPVTIDQQPPQKGDMRDTYADTTRARADLGFAPSVTLEEGLRAMWRWMEATRSMSAIADLADGAGAAAGRRSPAAVPQTQAPCRPARADADKFLFDRGTEAAQGTQVAAGARVLPPDLSTTTRRARIGPTPSWRSATPTSASTPPKSLLLAANEFREFLTFYPTNPRADYAQFRLARSL